MEHLNIYITIVVGLLAAVYFYIKRKYSYWESRGVPFIKPEFPYGNVRALSRTMHFSALTKQFYDQMKSKGPFCGIYVLQRPVAFLMDKTLIKQILIKDFANFNDRGIYYNEKDDPISAHLFSIEGNRWRTLRTKLTPTFTSGKMKFMYPTIIEVADRFKDCLSELVQDNTELEIKDLLARFSTDVIGTCAFGIECNSLKDPNAEFREMGRRSIEKPRHRAIVSQMLGSFKTLARFLGMKTTPEDVLQFFLKVVNETVELRKKNNINRNDLMDLLINLKSNENGVGSLTINEIAAQAFLFFLAGFETSSTTMAFCLYELAINPDIQVKARHEIREILKRHDGKFTYEAMIEMHYLDQVINETLRKYPPLPILTRSTQNDYSVPGTKFVIEKGTQVWIPAHAIQHDPDNYPNPEKFDPDRFTAEEVANRDSTLWLPFGEGPRNCVGLRFGMMQTRVGLVTLLNNFEISASSKTTVPLDISKRGFILAPEGGMWLTLKQMQG